MIKILSACGAGINSSHQIKTAIEEEMRNRGYEVEVDAVVIKDITEDMIKEYDVFAPISKPDFGYDIPIPMVEAGAILYRMPTMSQPIFDELEEIIKKINK
jgi:PTS system galactitol-specific IIB component